MLLFEVPIELDIDKSKVEDVVTVIWTYLLLSDKQIINTQVKLAALRSCYKELPTCHLQGALPTHPFTLPGSASLCTIATLQISLFYFSSVLLALQ